MAKESVESIKRGSEGLRGTLATELRNDEDYFSEAAKQILKFHGIYQQQDRDARGGKRGERAHTFMLRTKLPGGELTAEQYLAHDWIASEFANDTLRITTRQDFQFHGVIRHDLQDTLRKLNRVLITTLGACGDIVRNVIACPAPTSDPQRQAVQNFAHELTRALYPRTSAYHQIWIDGEEMIEDAVVEDPLYGPAFLPRKFKIAIAFPGDNCVDVYTNDVGLIAVFDDSNRLAGFNLLAGGGMGVTHNNDQTFARLADVLGFIEPEQVLPAVAAIVTVFRDYGDRENRKHARLKYLLHEWGVERFVDELHNRLDFQIQPARPIPPFEIHDHLGWHQQAEDLWYLGIPVDSGRVGDWGDYRLRSGLRAIIERFNLPVRLTPQQSILLTGITTAQRGDIGRLLDEYGIWTVEALSNVRRYGLACPALPTCGLAITEAERVFPRVVEELESQLQDLGLQDEPISVRMTGCPNGCARPYVAEIAFVGRSLDKYTIYLAGSAVGTRLAQPYLDLVHIDDLIPALRPTLQFYRDFRLDRERFGDFCDRIGVETLRGLARQQAESSAD